MVPIQFLLFIFLSFSPVAEPAEKAYIIAQINELRASGCKCGNKRMKPAPPLKWNDKLYASSLEHAKDMANNNFFSHFSRSGQDVGDRVQKFNYDWILIGENLGKGQKNFDEVLASWKSSKNHCEILMNPMMKEVAVANYRNYWVQHFGLENTK